MSPHPIRWGILGTGWIADKLTGDLLVDPKTRKVDDVVHKIGAVGSRSKESAQKFIDAIFDKAGVEGREEATAHGSYADLVADPNVDVVYIATPHSHHFATVHLALSAGKNVLCEKPFVINAAQAQILVDLAREKNVFLMEAVWTRFQPFAYKLQEIVRSGVLGSIRGFNAELCEDKSPAVAADPGHRLVNPSLAGGALLDLGPYAWLEAALVLLPPSTASVEPFPIPKVVSHMTLTPTGVDKVTTFIVEFPQSDGSIVPAVLTAAQDRLTSANRCVLVAGSKGYLEVHAPAWRPTGISYKAWSTEEEYLAEEQKNPVKDETFDFSDRPAGIWGMAYEADEVARCIRDGKKESDRMPLRETILQMQVFDECRRQNGFRYPDELESTELKK